MRKDNHWLEQNKQAGSGRAHLIDNQVRVSFSPAHLNGVQVVAGSNPAAPRLDWGYLPASSVGFADILTITYKKINDG